MTESVSAYLDQHQEELYTFLSELLKIDTQNFTTHGNEEAGQRFLMDYCRQNGWDATLYYPDAVEGLTAHEGYLANRGTDRRPNVTVCFPGKTGKEKITLMAHIDTMPIGEESSWTVPPLGGIIRDQKIWGRGVSDDKYGIAAALFALKAIRECGIELDQDVFVTSYADEEMGGGNGSLASCLKFPSDVYINLDGGSMEVWPYGIGGLHGNASLHKEETLSSASSVFAGLKILVDEFEAFGEKRFAELQANPIFRDTPIQKDAYRLVGVNCGSGGLDLNSAHISFTYYTLSQQEAIEKELAALMARVTEKLESMGLVFDGVKAVSRFFHPICPETIPEDALLYGAQLEKAKGSPVRYAGGCLSDLSVIHKYGGGIAFNTGLYLGFDDYGGPHQPDEYVRCEDLLAITKALAFYLIKKTYGKGEENNERI